MNFRKEVVLNLQDVQGEVRVVFSPLAFNVYHNGKKIKKKGGLKAKFPITTTSGEVVPIIIRNGKGMVRTAHFKDQQIPLEEKMTVVEQLIGIGSMCVVFIAGCVLFGFIGGVLGGALIGATVGLGVMLNFAFIRQEKSMMLKLLVSVGISAVAYLIYFIVGMMVVSLLHGAMMPMFY